MFSPIHPNEWGAIPAKSKFSGIKMQTNTYFNYSFVLKDNQKQTDKKTFKQVNV
jgi:hypothetical protein